MMQPVKINMQPVNVNMSSCCSVDRDELAQEANCTVYIRVKQTDRVWYEF